MGKTKTTATLFALLAALLYALNAPLSKLLLEDVPPTMMAAFLYLGAGAGMLAVRLVRRLVSGEAQTEAPLTRAEEPLTRRELPYTVGMVLLDIAAPICLMLGLTMTSAAGASLLNNFEIVATSLIALLLFREKISPTLWGAIGLVTVASVLLSLEGEGEITLSVGSIFVLLACLFWGLENNCTRALSEKDPLQIVVIKGFGSGVGSLVIALCIGEAFPALTMILPALCLGFVAYGLSILFYIYAQRYLGAAKTSAYYAVSPFLGAGMSMLLFRRLPGVLYWIALLVMGAGVWLTILDTKETD